MILDLDYTLLDTGRFKEALISALVSCGPTREQFEQSYREVVGRGGVVYDYDPDLQLELLGDALQCSKEEVKTKIDAVVNGSQSYLYPGAMEFLERLRGRGAKLVLLTLGNPDWQRRKVDRSGIADLFDKVVTTGKGKAEAIREQGGDPDTVVVNDNGQEIAAMRSAAPEFRYIMKQGPKSAPVGLGVPVCKTFEEIEGLI